MNQHSNHSLTMDSRDIGRRKFITVLDALSVERQKVLALQERTLKGDFPESYYEYTQFGGDFSEVQEAILEDIRDKITVNCTKYNETQGWIDKLSPRSDLLIKSKNFHCVTFDPQAKLTDGNRKRRAKKHRQRPVEDMSVKEWHASVSREMSLLSLC
jgi:hypothetical protein